MGPRTGSPGWAPATGRSRSRPTTVLCPQGEAAGRRHPSGVENDHPEMVPRGCDAVQIPPVVVSERRPSGRQRRPWSRSRENSRSPNSFLPAARRRQADSLTLQCSTVVRPSVSRRTCLVLVGPTSSPDAPLSMVSTLLSSSPKRRATNSPLLAPESAASRTASWTYSALCSAFNEPIEPSSAASAFSTRFSDASISVATSPTGTCMRVPARGGPYMSLIGLWSMIDSDCAHPKDERSTRNRNDRWTVRPEAGSTPTAMRISKTPGRRSRSDPWPQTPIRQKEGQK